MTQEELGLDTRGVRVGWGRPTQVFPSWQHHTAVVCLILHPLQSQSGLTNEGSEALEEVSAANGTPDPLLILRY